ncbi:hypothetical protein JCM10908_000613 [Rhodotorula pacifica]|uniref:uncharacterized protein n=1 Tax=Rhodotorula pacifica TaxID=1495444 RepID=UPI00317E1355
MPAPHLPVELIRRILDHYASEGTSLLPQGFDTLKCAMATFALVSKTWRSLTDERIFRELRFGLRDAPSAGDRMIYACAMRPHVLRHTSEVSIYIARRSDDVKVLGASPYSRAAAFLRLFLRRTEQGPDRSGEVDSLTLKSLSIQVLDENGDAPAADVQDMLRSLACVGSVEILGVNFRGTAAPADDLKPLFPRHDTRLQTRTLEYSFGPVPGEEDDDPQDVFPALESQLLLAISPTEIHSLYSKAHSFNDDVYDWLSGCHNMRLLHLRAGQFDPTDLRTMPAALDALYDVLPSLASLQSLAVSAFPDYDVPFSRLLWSWHSREPILLDLHRFLAALPPSIHDAQVNNYWFHFPPTFPQLVPDRNMMSVIVGQINSDLLQWVTVQLFARPEVLPACGRRMFGLLPGPDGTTKTWTLLTEPPDTDSDIGADANADGN